MDEIINEKRKTQNIKKPTCTWTVESSNSTDSFSCLLNPESWQIKRKCWLRAQNNNNNNKKKKWIKNEKKTNSWA